MINEEETAKLSDEDRFEYVDDTAYGLGVRKIEYVVCQDDYGNYKTRKNHLDNGLADPYRNASGRLGAIKKGKKKE